MTRPNQARIYKPFIKWAGGKSQLIPHLEKYLPAQYNNYIEPFIGGGALFFHLAPDRAVIGDSNPELITMYTVVQKKVDKLISLLSSYPHNKDFFYKIRSKKTADLDEIEIAARFIYLNKTGFNGLYRVNKKGEYNVPFGSQKNPKIYDEKRLRDASILLKHAKIVHGDYEEVLTKYTKPNDFVFLDPPYHPSSMYSDFTRFTKEFFYEKDQVNLAITFRKLVDLGALCILTNSNTEFIRRLYQGFEIKVVNTKRNINSNGAKRKGEDLIVISPAFTPAAAKRTKRNPGATKHFPGTRYMGSKNSMLEFIWDSVSGNKFTTVFDAFAGSGCVSYLFKTKGKKVFSNDFLNFSYHISAALVENNHSSLDVDDIYFLLSKTPHSPTFIQDNFSGLYFSDEENSFLDNVRFNIEGLNDNYKKSIAISALVRACMKKRARGIFTYTGNRYNDNRKDIRISLRDHFLIAVNDFNNAVFDNSQENKAFNADVFNIDLKPDLVYIDPPYYSPKSDSDYVRRYHFVEGLARYWQGLNLQLETKTKKFKKYSTDFDGKESTYEGFSRLFEKFRKSILVVSYSSNSLPNKLELTDLIRQFKKKVDVFEVDHQYSFGTQPKTKHNGTNQVKEYLFVGS